MINRYSLAFLAMSLTLGGPLWAVEAGNSIDQEQSKVETSLEGKSDTDKTTSLSTHFGVDQQTVSDLRTKGRGWGEVSIELSMAKQLMASDPSAYPTMADALSKIDGLRAGGQGWGQIAHQFGMKLGPIVSESQRMRNEARREARREARTERAAHRDASVDRPRHERAAKPEKFSKPGR